MNPATNEPRAKAALRWFAVFGSFALAHLSGFVASATCLIAIPAVAATALYFVLILIAVLTNQGIGSPAALPLWLAGILIGGGTATAAVCAAGVVTDVLRRALRWPVWTSPLAVFAILATIAVIWRFSADVSTPAALLQAAFLTAAGMAAFALYWVPLAATEVTMRLASWCLAKLTAKIRERRELELRRRSAA